MLILRSARVRAPKIGKDHIEPLTNAQLKAMLVACRGTKIRDRRDESPIRLMFISGARAGDVFA